MKRLYLACVGVVALAGTAAAADLPRPAPVYAPIAPVYAPAYTWSGFYLGVNGGGGWGRSNWNSTGGFNVSGGLVGGTVGYNYQIGQAVLGVEGDIDWADVNGNTVTAACPLGCKTSNTWLSTVRGRLGYAADRFMPYVTGGAAFGDIRASTPGFAGTNTTNAGWTAGAGIEFALPGHWTAKAEYLYVDLGSVSCGLGCGTALVNNVSFHENLGRAGINYRF
jgi:outer membrane immunogenic protein